MVHQSLIFPVRRELKNLQLQIYCIVKLFMQKCRTEIGCGQRHVGVEARAPLCRFYE